MNITLGSKVKDRITGFTGIVISRHDYLNGCRRLSVEPQTLHDGKPIEAQCFDVEQLVLVKPPEKWVGLHNAPGSEGGPQPRVSRAAIPKRA